MVLDIIHNGGVVRISSSSMECFIRGCKFRYVPTAVSR